MARPAAIKRILWASKGGPDGAGRGALWMAARSRGGPGGSMSVEIFVAFASFGNYGARGESNRTFCKLEAKAIIVRQ